MKSRVSVIKHLGEQSELWLNYWHQSEVNQITNLEKIVLLETLFNDIKASLKTDSCITNGVLESGISEKIDTNKQLMYINLNLHEYLIELIQDSMQTLIELHTDSQNSTKTEAKNRLVFLFTKCFEILSSLCHKNKKIQKIFFFKIQIFTSNLQISLGQIELLCNIFSNNKKLCVSVTQEFLKLFVELINQHGRRAEYLKIFKVVLAVKDKHIQENQRLVATLLLDGNYRHVCFMKNDSKNIFDMELNENSQKLKENYYDEPLYYHAELLNVFAMCSHGRSGVYLTEMKFQKLLNVEYLFELMNKKNPWHLNLFTPALKFLYHVYIDTEKNHEDVINSQCLIEFIKAQSEELMTLNEFSDDKIVNIELIVKILDKCNFFYSDADVFDTLHEYVNLYLVALLNKFDFIVDRVNSQILDKIEQLGMKFGIEFPIVIVNDLPNPRKLRKNTKNPIKNT